jgi:hypothetical protein
LEAKLLHQDTVISKQNQFAEEIKSVFEDEIAEFLEEMVRSIERDNPKLGMHYIEELMWRFLDNMMSDVVYDIGSRLFNKLSGEGFWGYCEPKDCENCAQSCKITPI